jgi:2-polyprenyl-6-methoxyphenol hydroxylase-like FAD-dependent oxidoreductase
MYDVIVVGARCAGAPTAMLLARRGHRVLLLDRAKFPSDSFRNHAIVHPGVRLLRDGDRVVGIRGETATGDPCQERATLVIGADGLHSVVARAVQAPIHDDRHSLTCSYYSYFSEVALSGVEMYAAEGAFLVAFGTNDGLVCVAVQVPVAQFDAFRSDVAGNFDEVLGRFPGIAERVRAGRRAERFQGTGELPNFFRQAAGPGWALAGDAGFHKDPITAHGVSDAFRDASLLAGAVDAGLRGETPLPEALAAYERQRNEMSALPYQLTVDAAALGPLSPPLAMVRAALRNNQAESDQYVSAFAGAISPAAFFAPDNIGRILQSGRP